MLIEDLKRHGVKLPYISSEKDIRQYVLQHGLATAEDIDSAEKRIEKRLYWYEKMKPEYEAFVADKINGADYMFKNWFTLIGGDWSTEINEKSKREFLLITSVLSSTMVKRMFLVFFCMARRTIIVIWIRLTWIPSVFYFPICITWHFTRTRPRTWPFRAKRVRMKCASV